MLLSLSALVIVRVMCMFSIAFMHIASFRIYFIGDIFIIKILYYFYIIIILLYHLFANK